MEAMEVCADCGGIGFIITLVEVTEGCYEEFVMKCGCQKN